MSACPLVDCHTHTSFSDGHASFEENVRAAAAAGCQVMVSTDHLTLPASMDANCEVQVVEGDLPAHRLAFEDARKLAAQIAPELTFIYGFECDWYEGCEPLVERWSAGAVVRLGSGARRMGALCRRLVPRLRELAQLWRDGPSRSGHAFFEGGLRARL